MIHPMLREPARRAMLIGTGVLALAELLRAART